MDIDIPDKNNFVKSSTPSAHKFDNLPDKTQQAFAVRSV